MNPQDVIDEGNKRLKEIFNKHKEFSKIEDIIALTENVADIDGETLSSSMSIMSAYMSYLAGIVPKYTSLANSKYAYRKFSYAWEWNKLGDGFTGKAKDNEALKRIEKEYIDGLIHQYIADYLKNKYDSYSRHASILQSRLGYIRGEIFRANT